MACGCSGSGANANVQYKVIVAGGDTKLVDTPEEARVLRAANGPATIVVKVPKSG